MYRISNNIYRQKYSTLMKCYFIPGSPSPKCSDYPHNVGLWVDALTFAVVTIQIIIFDTQYSEMMRAYLIERAKKAG